MTVRTDYIIKTVSNANNRIITGTLQTFHTLFKAKTKTTTATTTTATYDMFVVIQELSSSSVYLLNKLSLHVYFNIKEIF